MCSIVFRDNSIKRNSGQRTPCAVVHVNKKTGEVTRSCVIHVSTNGCNADTSWAKAADHGSVNYGSYTAP